MHYSCDIGLSPLLNAPIRVLTLVRSVTVLILHALSSTSWAEILLWQNTEFAESVILSQYSRRETAATLSNLFRFGI